MRAFIFLISFTFILPSAFATKINQVIVVSKITDDYKLDDKGEFVLEKSQYHTARLLSSLKTRKTQ